MAEHSRPSPQFSHTSTAGGGSVGTGVGDGSAVGANVGVDVGSDRPPPSQDVKAAATMIEAEIPRSLRSVRYTFT
jgi:hypothetical protein